MWSWVVDNKQVLFSGIGTAVVIGVGRLIFKKRSASSTQNIRSGDNSTNIQAGGDINVGTKKTRGDVEEG
ncbi:MAG TPA: hypothetical protein ENH13_01885 [Euryarchaeota archaeon]|nr:hypothetical protein [Euryarchaeota archaeon]